MISCESTTFNFIEKTLKYSGLLKSFYNKAVTSLNTTKFLCSMFHVPSKIKLKSPRNKRILLFCFRISLLHINWTFIDPYLHTNVSNHIVWAWVKILLPANEMVASCTKNSTNVCQFVIVYDILCEFASLELLSPKCTVYKINNIALNSIAVKKGKLYSYCVFNNNCRILFSFFNSIRFTNTYSKFIST